MAKCFPLLMCLCLAPLPLMAQQNTLESTQAGALPCPGTPVQIPLSASEFRALDGNSRHLVFGSGLRVCFTQTAVTIHTPTPLTHSCTAIRDSPNEGLGHSFQAEDLPFHLWFFINPDASRPSLEIGLYREDQQLVWIDTAAPICTG